MHKVTRAIIMAAGKGERMKPATLTTPKPMIRVRGVRMIGSVIEALQKNGITDINIVTGYLGREFDVLKEEYEGLSFIDNPLYDTCNNISSLYAARHLLDRDVIITDADQIIYNPDILGADFEISGYNATEVTAPTDEWVMTVEDKIVTKCSRDGGDKGWQLYSISRWCREDALKLRELVEYEFDIRKNRDIYWDDIPMILHLDRFRLGIRKMSPDDIVEIDSYEELMKINNNVL